MYQIKVIPYLLKFRRPAGTSRGVYTDHKVWYVLIRPKNDPSKWGIGECAPLHDLSSDASPDYETTLKSFCREIEKSGYLDKEKLRSYPSMLFGLETACLHLNKGRFSFYDTPFSKGESGITINGLIWMGDYKRMLEQIEEKMKTGFRCIKLKIGAIDFEEEIKLLQHIRRHFSAKEIELRVDANGAFKPNEALKKLTRLSELELHSIEQPIAAGQWEKMAYLADNTPLAIALDEELIGINNPEEKKKLLQTIQPQYIILKPSLHGGLSGCNEWIDFTDKLNIKWWITSALESNIGLNSIAQWCATFSNPLPQGLGTGGLYFNNIEMPLSIRKDKLFFDKEKEHPVYTEYYDFLADWNNNSPTLDVQTSGSTGTPKLIAVEKEKMIQSAKLTNSFLNLKAGDKALLCMPLQYIGAKMMVVRSLVGDLELIVRQPSGHPLADMDCELGFVAMTPQQVYNSLQIPQEKEKLKQIKNLIIGGAAINPALEKEIKSFPNAVYSTYGMTETLSHIALRRLNGSQASDYYVPFDCVRLSVSDKGTLIIQAPFASQTTITTNDVVELNADNSFRISGRVDNFINTGGVKIQIETVEDKLTTILEHPFAVTSIPDPKFGEAIVLLTEKELNSNETLTIKNILSKYEQPKYIIVTDTIPLTGNGKVDRTRSKQIAQISNLKSFE